MDTSTNRTVQRGDLVEVIPYGDIFVVDEIDLSRRIIFLVPMITDSRWGMDARGRAPFGYPLSSWMRKLEYPDAE